jgi:hypothetical protein
VAEAVYTARYHRVLALKLTAALKLRGAGCHGDAAELDAGAADPSPRGAGGEDGEVAGGLPPDGSGGGGRCGGWGAVGGGRGCVLREPPPSPGPPLPVSTRGFPADCSSPLCVCVAYQIKRLVCALRHHLPRCFGLCRLSPPVTVAVYVFVAAPLGPKYEAVVASVFSRLSLLKGGLTVHHPLLHCYLHRVTPVHTHTALPAVVAYHVERALPWSSTVGLVCCFGSPLCTC